MTSVQPAVVKRSRRKDVASVESGVKGAILEAALKAFAADGFDGASLPKIAKMAGTTHPLIHYHFQSKDNLWRKTIEYTFADLMPELKAVELASRTLAPLDRLRVLVRSVAHFVARYPEHLAMVMAEVRSNSERLRWLKENYSNQFLLNRILKEAQTKKIIRKIPLENLSYALLGAVFFYFCTNDFAEDKKSRDIEALADKHADCVLDIFLNGICCK